VCSGRAAACSLPAGGGAELPAGEHGRRDLTEAEMCERKESTGEGEARTIQSNRERFKEKRARQKRERERKKNTGETETGRMDLGHGQNGKIRCPVKEK